MKWLCSAGARPSPLWSSGPARWISTPPPRWSVRDRDLRTPLAQLLRQEATRSRSSRRRRNPAQLQAPVEWQLLCLQSAECHLASAVPEFLWRTQMKQMSWHWHWGAEDTKRWASSCDAPQTMNWEHSWGSILVLILVGKVIAKFRVYCEIPIFLRLTFMLHFVSDCVPGPQSLIFIVTKLWGLRWWQPVSFENERNYVSCRS